MDDGCTIEDPQLVELSLALPKGDIAKLAKLNLSPAEGSHAASLEYLAEVALQLRDARGYSVVGLGPKSFSRFIAYGPKAHGRHQGTLVVTAAVRVGIDEALTQLQLSLGFVNRAHLLRWLIENILPVAIALRSGQELYVNFREDGQRKLVAPHRAEA